MISVCMCGSRTWKLQPVIETEVSRLIDKYGDGLLIRHGDEPNGADERIRLACEYFGVRHIQYCATAPLHKPHIKFHSIWVSDWSTDGRMAGPIRNAAMIKSGITGVVAFRMSDVSKGTDNMCKLAQDAGIPIIIRNYNDYCI